MKNRALTGLLAALSLAILAGCGSNPVPPDWKTNAQSALQSYEQAYLKGSVAADLSLARARSEAARTGQPAWVARIELASCGTRAAALDFDACPAYSALQENATPEERSYAAFLAGNWQAVDAKALPGQYVGVLAKGPDALGAIADPLSRLIAAAVLFRRGELPPSGVDLAVDTASERGWRRPLLAWLGVALKHAEAAGDQATSAKLRQRIAIVESSVSH